MYSSHSHQVMYQDFTVLRSGATAQTFDAYDDVRTLVSKLHPEAQYQPWSEHFDGRLWREVHDSGQYVLAIRTRLSAGELEELGVE